ncbi:MAG: von Willebrand factor type A domain-containing protein [Clostridia bacterium]|nr:von Willebrand factor type A domain-containing protein [Clostridia bacterium]
MRKRKWLFTVLSLVLCTGILTSCSGAGMFGGIGVGDAMGNLDGEFGGEEYTEIVENAFIKTSEQPSSYFSIDANTASYPNLRSLINNGATNIPKDAVRVEEMLNYFEYDYATPTGDNILALTSSVFDTPYNSETKLLTIGLAAKEVEFTEQSNNIVFLIDVSGSMNSADKLPLVQASFSMLAENLNPTDRVSIVTYAGEDSIALEGAFGYEQKKIVGTIEDLAAGGSTAGSKGIKTAYALAEKYFIEGGNNRVILATDGDFNVGLSIVEDLERFISRKRESGVYFSVFGFGHGNIKSDKMETLALNGNGTYSYIDSLTEARRALVTNIGGTMLTVAKDVKAGITFNPAYVESYRLIGYENKLLTQEEFENDATDAGELGSGHTVTVVYEIKLAEPTEACEDFFGEVVIKYKPTENGGGAQEESKEASLIVPLSAYHKTPTDNDKFVASVVEFALLLRDSQYKGDANFTALIKRLNSLNLSGDEFKTEFRDLVKTYYTNTLG